MVGSSNFSANAEGTDNGGFPHVGKSLHNLRTVALQARGLCQGQTRAASDIRLYKTSNGNGDLDLDILGCQKDLAKTIAFRIWLCPRPRRQCHG